MKKKNDSIAKISGKNSDFYIYNTYPNIQLDGKEESIERYWFKGFCTNSEIERIITPKKAEDYILQKRANIIADNARYTRVYCAKARTIKNWSLEKSFSIKHYKNFLSRLTEEDKEVCNTIGYGDIFSNTLNGFAENTTKFGKIIYLNESLRYYLYYMLLATMNFGVEIPKHVRLSALRIAIRIFLGTETMDFYLDPRGKVPKKISNDINKIVNEQLQFIAGHEFSHHLCGHLNKNFYSTRTFYTDYKGLEYKTDIFNNDQKEEFEADINSLTRPRYNKFQYRMKYEAALIWFIFLDIGEFVLEQINPPFNVYNTHPTPIDRFVKIRDEVPTPLNFNGNSIDYFFESAKIIKDFLAESLSVDFDGYEMYGSVYLDKPNTKWRGKKLMDRVDY